MGCATTSVKVLFIIFNIILAIFAVAAIIVVAVNPASLPHDFVIPFYIVLGLLLVFTVVGCLAAIRESICLTITYAVLLLAWVILFIIGMCTLRSQRDWQIGITSVEDDWNRNAMDPLQIEYNCCGKDSPQDYILLNRIIPASCYKGQNDANSADLYTDGCSAKVQRFYDDKTMIFDYLVWALIGLEIFGFILAVFLAISFHNNQRRMQF